MHASLTLTISAGLLSSIAAAAGGLASEDARIRAEAASHAWLGKGADECAACRAASFSGHGAVNKGSIPFDEATGRRLANYPPSRPVSFERMRLDISIDDMNRPTLDAVQTLTLVPTGWALDELLLDAQGMKISRVESPDRRVSFEHDGTILRVRFDPKPAPGERTILKTTYSVTNPPAGLIWTPESSAWPGRPAQLHTQGQPETNSYWFPCHDFPNQRLDTELRVVVPQGFDVCSNGRLVAHDRIIRTTKDKLGGSVMLPGEAFHWVQDHSSGGSHVNYLVSMVVGKFDVIDVGSQSLPMPVYVPRGRGTDVPGTFGRTPAMIEALSDRFGAPYPWAKYAQCVVWNFGAGGMENTSATTLYDTAIISPAALPEFDFDGLISHELGHQWFGDLVTCRSWEHIWLNEGFATFSSALWAEQRSAPEGGPESYETLVRGYFDDTIANDRPEAPYVQSMVSKAYSHPWETFRRPANPYGKGASILHMLRVHLGDEVFFRGIAAYVGRFKHQTVETPDLRKTLEEVSGESLEQFFAQWCFRPGVPTLKVEPEYDGATGELRVNVEQAQNIDADNPAFEFTLPIWVGDPKGASGTWLEVPVAGRAASASFTLNHAPAIIAVDPRMAVLAGLRIGLTPDRWTAQLAGGPTFASRVQAARALGAIGAEAGSPEIGATLFALAMDRSENRALRAEAIRALSAMRDAEHVETLAAAQLTPLSVREAAARALGEVAASRDDSEWKSFRSRATTLLAQIVERDPSPKTRAAAVSALGTLKAADRITVILDACKVESQDDVVRQAGIGALADLEVPRQAAVVIGFTREGVISRTRAKATESLGRMGATDRDAAYGRLAELLTDRETRVRAAARQAMVDLADPRGIPELEKAAASRGDADRADAAVCLRKLRQKVSAPGSDAQGG